MDIVGRLFKAPLGSFFLFGPRGTGKSTLLKANFPDALIVDLLDPHSYRTYVGHPEQLRALVEGNPGISRLVTDSLFIKDLQSLVCLQPGNAASQLPVPMVRHR